VSVDIEVPFGTGAIESIQEDLMSSKIISRAACLAELTSNPKSFFNCPDLHGGPGLPEGIFRSGEMDPPGNPEETITLSEATGKPETTGRGHI
jgi:hypothetical protein